MSLLLGFTNWKQICPVSEIQIENQMPFYKSKSGLWQSWITVPKHDSVLQVYIRPVTKLNYSSKTWFSFSGQKQICAKTETQIFPSTCKTSLFQMNFLGNKMESHLSHVGFGNLWNRHEPWFCNRHVCYQGRVVAHRLCCRSVTDMFYKVCKLFGVTQIFIKFTDCITGLRQTCKTDSVIQICCRTGFSCRLN